MADLITSLAQAIQQFEGWSPGSVSQRNNNPGNLRSGAGMIGTDANGFAVFPDYQTGWNALLNQVQLNVNRGLSVDEFFAGKPGVYAGYAPSADSNQPLQYAATVASWIGVDPSVPLNQMGTTGVSTDVTGGSQPLVDLSGSAATTDTASIMSQLDLSSIDFSSSPGTAIAVALGVAAIAVLLSR